MNCWREEIVGLDLDETAVGGTFGEEGDFAVWGGVGVPAEDGGVECLNAGKVGAGDFGPGDHLVGC